MSCSRNTFLRECTEWILQTFMTQAKLPLITVLLKKDVGKKIAKTSLTHFHTWVLSALIWGIQGSLWHPIILIFVWWDWSRSLEILSQDLGSGLIWVITYLPSSKRIICRVYATAPWGIIIINNCHLLQLCKQRAGGLVTVIVFTWSDKQEEKLVIIWVTVFEHYISRFTWTYCPPSTIA